MKNLELINNKWNNLEESFKASGETNRLEYLHKLTGFNKETNITMLDYLRSKMSKELKEYNQEELDLYSAICKKFDDIERFLKTTTVESIDNLNDLENFAMQQSNLVANQTKKLPDDFFNSLLPIPSNTTAQFQKEHESFFDSIYKSVEGFGDVFYLDNGKVRQTFMSKNYTDAFVLYSKYDIADLKNSIKNNKTRFNTAVYKACAILVEENKLVSNLIFLDRKYLEIKTNEDGKEIANVKLPNFEQDIKLTKRNILESEDEKYYSLNLQTKYDKFKIIFV